MKYLLTIFTLVILVTCNGQKKDTTFSALTYYADTGWIIMPKNDTVKVLMLVSDTSWSQFTATTMQLNYGPTFWQLGYEVIGFTGSPTYLDIGFNPLPSEKVVWMAKRLRFIVPPLIITNAN